MNGGMEEGQILWNLKRQRFYIAKRNWVRSEDRIATFDVVVDVEDEPCMIKSTQDSDGEDEYVDT